MPESTNYLYINMESVTGLEPAKPPAWEAGILPIELHRHIKRPTKQHIPASNFGLQDWSQAQYHIGHVHSKIYIWARDTFETTEPSLFAWLYVSQPISTNVIQQPRPQRHGLEECCYGLLTAYQLCVLVRAILLGAAPDHLLLCRLKFLPTAQMAWHHSTSTISIRRIARGIELH